MAGSEWRKPDPKGNALIRIRNVVSFRVLEKRYYYSLAYIILKILFDEGVPYGPGFRHSPAKCGIKQWLNP
jgi:hypothetical protein